MYDYNGILGNYWKFANPNINNPETTDELKPAEQTNPPLPVALPPEKNSYSDEMVNLKNIAAKYKAQQANQDEAEGKLAQATAAGNMLAIPIRMLDDIAAIRGGHHNSDIANSVVKATTAAPQAAMADALQKQKELLAQYNMQKGIEGATQSADLRKRGLDLEQLRLLDSEQARKDAAAKRISDKEEKDAANQEKNDIKTDKEMREFADKARFANRSDLPGKTLEMMSQRINRLEALKTQFPNGDIPLILNPELATGLAAMATGANSPQSEAQIKSLMSRTGQTDINSALQYLTGKPMDNGTRDIIKQLYTTMERESDVNKQMIDEERKKMIASNWNLRKRDKASFERILESIGINKEHISDNGIWDYAKQRQKEKNNNGLPQNQQQGGTALPIVNKNNSTTKVVNGKTYKKVEGGWKEI